MPPQASQRGGLRPKLRQRLNHLRHKFRKDPGTNIDPTLIPLLGPTASALAVQSSPSFSQTHDAAGEPASGDNPPANVAISLGGFERNSSLTVSTLGPNVVVVASDLWSSAYREAVESLGEDIDVAILKGENVAQLFRQLGEIDSEVTQDSAFLRGVRYLQSIQVPLERFKMALDLAAPLTTVAPLTGTALGVVQGVTAVSSLCRHLPNRGMHRPNYFCHRLPSAFRRLILSLQPRSERCWSKYRTLTIVTRLVRKQREWMCTRYDRVYLLLPPFPLASF